MRIIYSTIKNTIWNSMKATWQSPNEDGRVQLPKHDNNKEGDNSPHVNTCRCSSSGIINDERWIGKSNLVSQNILKKNRYV